MNRTKNAYLQRSIVFALTRQNLCYSIHYIVLFTCLPIHTAYTYTVSKTSLISIEQLAFLAQTLILNKASVHTSRKHAVAAGCIDCGVRGIITTSYYCMKLILAAGDSIQYLYFIHCKTLSRSGRLESLTSSVYYVISTAGLLGSK